MSAYKLYPSEKIHDLREMLHSSARKFPMRPALLQKENGFYHAYTYIRLKMDVESLGEALCAHGFAGKRILILGENSYGWALSYLTAVTGLGVAVPLDKELPSEEVAHIADIAEGAVILYSEKYGQKLEKLPADFPRYSFDELSDLIEEGHDLLAGGKAEFEHRFIDTDALAVLIFTSGTTGVSKGVMLSQRNLCHTMENLGKMVRISEEDRALSVLPLHHVYECTCGLLCPLYRGASVAFCDDLRNLTRDMQEVRPSVMISVPRRIETGYHKIWATIQKQGLEKRVRNTIKLCNALPDGTTRAKAKRKLFSKIHESFGGQLRLLLSGGAPADPEVLKGLRDFGICAYQTYSLSECAPIAAINRDNYYRDASAGLAFPNALLDIYDMGDDGIGEIRYKAPNVMLGYFDMPEKSARAIRDGWFYTGDLGTIDEEGFLYIVGGKKNVITTAGGKSVFPEELEKLLVHSEFIKEAGVLGILDEKRREYDIVAIIHPDDAHFTAVYGSDYSKAQVELELKKVISSVNAAVRPYKRIRSYRISHAELPKSSSRKLDRRRLAEVAGK